MSSLTEGGSCFFVSESNSKCNRVLSQRRCSEDVTLTSVLIKFTLIIDADMHTPALELHFHPAWWSSRASPS